MFLQFRLKHFSNHRIFVTVIDHVAAMSKADRVQAMRSSTPRHSLDPILAADPGGCHVPGRRSAGVEMLMKPAVGWHKQRSFFPINAHLLRRFGILRHVRPHQAVTYPVEHQDMRAWSVTMRTLV